MKEEQKAEEYFENLKYHNIIQYDLGAKKEVKQAFIDGYHECQKEHEWHDLEKDPTDLPKEGVDVLVKLENGNHEVSGVSSDKRWFCTDYYTGEDKVIKWKEIE